MNNPRRLGHTSQRAKDSYQRHLRQFAQELKLEPRLDLDGLKGRADERVRVVGAWRRKMTQVLNDFKSRYHWCGGEQREAVKDSIERAEEEIARLESFEDMLSQELARSRRLSHIARHPPELQEEPLGDDDEDDNGGVKSKLTVAKASDTRSQSADRNAQHDPKKGSRADIQASNMRSYTNVRIVQQDPTTASERDMEEAQDVSELLPREPQKGNADKHIAEDLTHGGADQTNLVVLAIEAKGDKDMDGCDAEEARLSVREMVDTILCEEGVTLEALAEKLLPKARTGDTKDQGERLLEAVLRAAEANAREREARRRRVALMEQVHRDLANDVVKLKQYLARIPNLRAKSTVVKPSYVQTLSQHTSRIEA